MDDDTGTAVAQAAVVWPIPALSILGVLAMCTVLAAAGLWVLRQRLAG